MVEEGVCLSHGSQEEEVRRETEIGERERQRGREKR